MPWVDAYKIASPNPPTKKEKEQVVEYRRRKAKAKFYTDENIPRPAVQLLRANDIHVLTAQEAGRLGHPDENHSAFTLKNGYILLTCDLDYLDDHRFPCCSPR